MAGGPVNGGTPRGVAYSLGVGGAVDAIGGFVEKISGTGHKVTAYETNDTAILIPTVLQWASDSISYWTNMTALFNPNFDEGDSDVQTLPICLFHMKKMTETHQNDVSQQRVMLYETQKAPDTEEMANPVRKGVMQTVVDNIVRKPKTYNLELIVPLGHIGRYIKDGLKNIGTGVTFVTDLINGATESINVPGMGNPVQWVFNTLAGSTAITGTIKGVLDIADSLGTTNTVNKNSLEAMAQSGQILILKTWLGFDYKYVTITGLSIDKTPTEDDVFRATVQLQEMPVLQVNNLEAAEETPDPTKKSWLVAAAGAIADVISGAGTLAAKPLELLLYSAEESHKQGAAKAAADRLDALSTAPFAGRH
jgi:hypothetical protein